MADTAFFLKSIDISGVTVYDKAALQPFYANLVGITITPKQAAAIADGLIKKYHDDGFVLASAQMDEGDALHGVLRIVVHEGAINDIKVAGDYTKSQFSEAILQRMRSSAPLNIRALERDILLLNDVGNSVQASLQPPQDPSAAGDADLLLTFAHDAVLTRVDANDFNSRYLGFYQLGVETGVNSLLTPASQTLIGGSLSPFSNDYQYIHASHRMLVNSAGTAVTLQGDYTHVSPEYLLKDSDVHSNIYDAGLALSHPLLRSEAQNLYASGSFTFKGLDTSSFGSSIENDSLRVVQLSANYDLTDGYHGSNAAELSASQGLNAFGSHSRVAGANQYYVVDDFGQFIVSRPSARTEFTKIDATASRLQTITDQWKCYLAATGQYAFDPLLALEQFSFGGQQFGRGYDPLEMTGDNGAAGLVELRYAINAGDAISPELFTSYDIGKVWDHVNEGNTRSGASLAIGARFTTTANISGSLMAAKPLTEKSTAPQFGNKSSPRFLADLSYQF